MCVILHKLKEQKPFTIEDIERACKTNPDGFSLTVLTNNGLDMLKTIDKKEFIETYTQLYNDKLLDDTEYIIHCRIKTNGKICKNNCHPFENEHYILWHNGIIGEFANDDKKVDSEQFLNKYFTDPNMKTETILKRFKKNSSSKFIIYRKKDGEVIQSDNFEDYNGNYASNLNFTYDYSKYYTNYYGSCYGNDYYDYYEDFWKEDPYDILYKAIDEFDEKKDRATKKDCLEHITMLENFIYEHCYY